MTEIADTSIGPKGRNEDRLIALIQPILEPLGFEVVHVEIVTSRQKILRLFVDRFGGGITLDDCATVSKTLDEPLDQASEVEAIFKGTYDLEVSSPGVDRPLRHARDFTRFAGREARIHVFRPLTSEELGDAGYHTRNPRQKNYLGTLRGMRGESLLLQVDAKGGPTQGKSGKKGAGKASKTNSAEAEQGTTVTIPLPLISKANLEPRFDFDGDRPAIDLGEASAH